MKITGLRSFMARDRDRPRVLVAIDTAEGITGWGEVRDGGSYEDRFRKIAVWNSLMDENDYLVKRWTEFLSA